MRLAPNVAVRWASSAAARWKKRHAFLIAMCIGSAMVQTIPSMISASPRMATVHSPIGARKTVERLVRAYRTERPDIVLPTFLDVPGQHGHHRAMTRAAEMAIQLAADPSAFPEHFAEGLTPWQVAKFYLPAWSGGGDTYDDELPPPDTTVTIHAAGRDPATGADFDRIGEWSRACHATQGMGHWPETPKVEWPLHLKLPESRAETTILEGFPETLAALAEADGLTLETWRQLLTLTHPLSRQSWLSPTAKPLSKTWSRLRKA